MTTTAETAPDERDSWEASPFFASSTVFAELSEEQRAEIWSRARIVKLTRGAVLYRQNSPADTVCIVLSGRFEVCLDGQPAPIAEVGVGEPIGEIGFFSSGIRRATIVATRDSFVLELDRTSFESVAQKIPAIYKSLIRVLARRLAQSNVFVLRERQAVRTVAVVPGGRVKIPPTFFERFQNVVEHGGKGLVLTDELLKTRFPQMALDEPTVSRWLNEIEHQYELIVYLGDDTLGDWTRKAVRQADQVLVVVVGDATAEDLSPVEAFAFAMHPAARRRLVLLHDHRVGSVVGTAGWLRDRDVAMHHHLALEDDVDFKSLHRFLTGHALGFVASGGGGFGPAHVGIYKAFQERGVTFDIFGGTSVGAAMLAGFAFLLSPEEVDMGTDDVFVKSRGFKRFTLPRYALLDHIEFDRALQRQYRGIRIEDAWRPYFSVAAVLDHSGRCAHVIRRGPLWKAVRASASIPAVLPPLFTDDGRILVDGGISDNIPLKQMKALKRGPNLVVNFGVRDPHRFAVDYMSIPGRWQLLTRMLTRGGRRKLPDVPGPIDVVLRCLVMNQSPELLPVEPSDLVLTTPSFPGVGFMDFARHSDVFHAAYTWCHAKIDELCNNGDEAMKAILAARN